MSVHKCSAARVQDSQCIEGFQECAPKVWRFLRYLGVLEPDLARLCQQVFMSVGASANLQDRTRALYAMYQSAVRIWCAYEPHSGFAVVDPQGRGEGARVELLELFARLSPQQRIVTTLYEIEGLSTEQIADLLQETRERVLEALAAGRAELLRDRTRAQSA